METRQIKDSQGNVVVTVSLPAETSEEKWAEVLSSYIVYELEN